MFQLCIAILVQNKSILVIEALALGCVILIFALRHWLHSRLENKIFRLSLRHQQNFSPFIPDITRGIFKYSLIVSLPLAIGIWVTGYVKLSSSFDNTIRKELSLKLANIIPKRNATLQQFKNIASGKTFEHFNEERNITSSMKDGWAYRLLGYEIFERINPIGNEKTVILVPSTWGKKDREADRTETHLFFTQWSGKPLWISLRTFNTMDTLTKRSGFFSRNIRSAMFFLSIPSLLLLILLFAFIPTFYTHIQHSRLISALRLFYKKRNQSPFEEVQFDRVCYPVLFRILGHRLKFWPCIFIDRKQKKKSVYVPCILLGGRVSPGILLKTYDWNTFFECAVQWLSILIFLVCPPAFSLLSFLQVRIMFKYLYLPISQHQTAKAYIRANSI